MKKCLGQCFQDEVDLWVQNWAHKRQDNWVAYSACTETTGCEGRRVSKRLYQVR